MKRLTGNRRGPHDYCNPSGALVADFCFARPCRSRERGANENLNGSIRQYIPKKTGASQNPQPHLKMEAADRRRSVANTLATPINIKNRKGERNEKTPKA